MIKRFFAKAKLKLNPPKAGDVFYGESFDFIIYQVEQRLHGMWDRTGYVKLWSIVPGDRTMKLTVEGDYGSYYRFTCEILASSSFDRGKMEWLKRSQPRRIRKEDFYDMILKGELKNER